MRVTLLYFDGCPSWKIAYERLLGLADELEFTATPRMVTSAREAEQLGFRGSPTITVDGRDVFADSDEPVGLSCRLYQTPHGPVGAPTVDQLREVLSRLGSTSAGLSADDISRPRSQYD